MQRSADWLSPQLLQLIKRAAVLREQVVECLPPLLGNQVQYVNYSDGCLTILVTDHNWSSNLVFHQRELVRKMELRFAVEVKQVRVATHNEMTPPNRTGPPRDSRTIADRRLTCERLRALSKRLTQANE
ncbi:MAG: DciA family protein [Thiotrichales bacterium]